MQSRDRPLNDLGRRPSAYARLPLLRSRALLPFPETVVPPKDR